MIHCQLCPKNCLIPDGKSGDCRVRVNKNGKLISTNYSRPCAIHIDPIEKKPLYHFLPGSAIFSIATAGCNLHCKNCQNWQISQSAVWETNNYWLPPEKAVNIAKEKKCISIAYTYTDPSIFYEYTHDIAVLANSKGIKNVMVTAGYINQNPARKLYKYIDASNTDLKSFEDSFYRSNCSATLKPVLDNLVLQREESTWIEVTNLIIPTLNDNMKMIEKMCKWIINNIGDYTPLHFSRFTPMYKLRNLPPTPVKTLLNARSVALNSGLKFVYIGNVTGIDAEDTYCPKCKTKVIDRTGYIINFNNLKNGQCPDCSETIEGVWKL